jgi:hypothetical protein
LEDGGEPVGSETSSTFGMRERIRFKVLVEEGDQ